MYGKDGGVFRIGCRVVKIRVYVERVLKVYKKFFSRVSFFWIVVVKI